MTQLLGRQPVSNLIMGNAEARLRMGSGQSRSHFPFEMSASLLLRPELIIPVTGTVIIR